MTSPHTSAWERFAGRPYAGTVAKAGAVRSTVRNAQDALCRLHLCRTRQRVNDSFRAGARPIQQPRSLGEECLFGCLEPGRGTTGVWWNGLMGRLRQPQYRPGRHTWLLIQPADARALRFLLYHDIPAMWRRSGA